MGIGSSWRLFSVRGIAIRVHITFPLILIWAAIQFSLLTDRGVTGAIFGIVVTLLLFAIVLLHELGHSVVALNYNVPVSQIVLLPIGGVAQLGRIPEEPDQEFMIAIAGPLVNFVLAILLGGAALVAGADLGRLAPAAVLESMGTLSVGAIYNYVFLSNVFLAVFNLLPAFPMDGGRVLRALLATRMDYGRATAIAVSVGQGMAWLLGLWGFLGGGFFVILIAIFIYMGAGQEGQLVALRQAFSGFTVEQAYSREARTLDPDATLRDAIDLTLSTFQADFPICDGDRLVGLLTYTQLIDAVAQHGSGVPVREVMMTDVETVTPSEQMFDVQQMLAERRLDAVPVVEDGHFLGLITNRDINELYRLISNQPELALASRR